MKALMLVILSASLLFSLCACTSFSQEAVPSPSVTQAPAATQNPLDSASTAQELRALIEQYKNESNYDMIYAASLRLVEIDPSDTAAYTDAMDALLAISLAGSEEINRLLAQGYENALDPQTMVWWLKQHESDFSFKLPFIPDYDSSQEINTQGITAGNLSAAFKDDGGWKAGLLTWQGSWVYLSCPGEDFSIFKMRTDGSEYQRVGEDSGSSLNVIGDWIYYINLSDGSKLYKMRTDGTMREKLSDNTGEFLSVSGEWMYYNNLDDSGCLYKAKTDGSEQTRLTDEAVLAPCVSGDWVYYRYHDEKDGLWRISINGGVAQQILNIRMREYCIMDDWIYCVNMDEIFCVRRVHTDGTGYEAFYPCEMSLDAVNGADGFLYLPYNFTNETQGIDLRKNFLILDMSSQSRLYDTQLNVGPIYAGPGGYMYFLKYDEGFFWYAISADGRMQALG